MASTPASSTSEARGPARCPAPGPSVTPPGRAWGKPACGICFCSIVEIDFFTLTFRQLERLVRREEWGESTPTRGWEGASVSLLLVA